MNSYEQRQEERRTRLEEAAARKRAEAEQLHAKAREMAAVIPFGQPIHVGHHSEKTDRSFRGRIDNTFRRSFETLDTARSLEAKAAAVGTGGISSDDPDAIEKLRAELAELEAEQERRKAVNRIILSKKLHQAGKAEAVRALGFSEERALELVRGDRFGTQGFPSYAISNNGANIRRVKERIALLEQQQAAARAQAEQGGPKETVYGDITVIEDAADNRVMVRFDSPATPVDARNALKARGFKWSPTRSAWVRQLPNGRYWAHELAKRFAVDAD